MYALWRFQQLTDTRPTQPLQMEKCASNLVSAPLVLLLLQPCSLSGDNLAILRAEHGEALPPSSTMTFSIFVPSALKNDPVQSGSTV